MAPAVPSTAPRLQGTSAAPSRLTSGKLLAAAHSQQKASEPTLEAVCRPRLPCPLLPHCGFVVLALLRTRLSAVHAVACPRASSASRAAWEGATVELAAQGIGAAP
eukprot:4682991-Lingulodinium_polyedra.AAC.1